MLTKSHGLGNDYLVVDPADLPFAVTPARARLLCDRHFGVGSDGLLVLDGELCLRIVNPDGSEAEKSGNGLRIFAKWLYDTGRVRAELAGYAPNSSRFARRVAAQPWRSKPRAAERAWLL